MYFFIYFSYNWPAQSDGVDYGDADEVNKICETYTAFYSVSYLLWTKETVKGRVLDKLIFSFLFFTGSFSPQVFVHHLTAETEDEMEPRQRQKLLRLTCNNDAPDGKVWGVTWHIII